MPNSFAFFKRPKGGEITLKFNNNSFLLASSAFCSRAVDLKELYTKNSTGISLHVYVFWENTAFFVKLCMFFRLILSYLRRDVHLVLKMSTRSSLENPQLLFIQLRLKFEIWEMP